MLGDGLPPVGKEIEPKLGTLSVTFTNSSEFSAYVALPDPSKSPTEFAAALTTSLSSCTSKDKFVTDSSACGGTTLATSGTWVAGTTLCYTFPFLVSNYAAFTTTATDTKWKSGGTAACGSNINLEIDKLINFFKSYLLVGGTPAGYVGKSIGTNYKNEVYDKEAQILGNMKTSLGTIDGVKNSVEEIKKFIKSIAGDIFGAFNCKIIRREVGIIQNVVCYQFSLNTARLSISITFLGIGLFWFSCCLCCAIRCKRANEKSDEPTPGANQVQPMSGKGAGSGKQNPMQYY